MIEAYKKLDENITSKHSLLIAGSGDMEYEGSLKLLAHKDAKYKNKILFLGHKQGIEKESLYKQCKVFVLPSYSENFGNVVLESLSFSTPVISSIYTPWEALEEAECGFWIDNKSADIANKLDLVLNFNESEYLNFSINSYNFVNHKYDISRNIEELQNTYMRYKK